MQCDLYTPRPSLDEENEKKQKSKTTELVPKRQVWGRAHMPLFAGLSAVLLVLPPEAHQSKKYGEHIATAALQQPQPSLASRARTSNETNSTLPWLVFTLARTGSRWFVDTLRERSGGLLPSSIKETTCSSSCVCHDVGSDDTLAVSKCIDELDTGFKMLALNHSSLHPGNKFMTRYSRPDSRGPAAFNVLAQAVCKLDVAFIFMWRRNILRRIISNEANVWDEKHPALPDHQPHPESEQEADALREYKPRLDPSTLLDMIEGELELQQSIEKAFAKLAPKCDAAARAATFYYEDLIDTNEDSSKAWGQALQILRIWPKSQYAVIHGDTPVLETVANPDEVVRGLNSTRHAWMLWDHSSGVRTG